MTFDEAMTAAQAVAGPDGHEDQEVIVALEAAATLLQGDGVWTQGVMARDAAGTQIGYGEPDARQFCVIGALNLFGSNAFVVDAATDALWYALGSREYCDCQIADWNDADGRTAEEVVAALRAAAESLT